MANKNTKKLSKRRPAKAAHRKVRPASHKKTEKASVRKVRPASHKKTEKASVRKVLPARDREREKTAVKSKPRQPSRKSLLLKAQADAEEALASSARAKEVGVILSDRVFNEFVVKNVGKLGVDLINNLNSAPHTDDKLAVKMDVKVNEVRRMLNVLNGYGITKYDINKDGKGWLTFKWYLDREKMIAFRGTLADKPGDANPTVNGECNDFFYCVSCYGDQKVILPFDSAFEIKFTCECGKALAALDRSQVSALFSENQAQA